MLLVSSLLACGGAAKKDITAMPRADTAVDDWQHGPVWLHATAGVPGDHQTECEWVAKRLAEEAGCKGAICRHAVELASEWLDKCDALLPDQVEGLSDLHVGLEDEADRSASRCAKEHAKVLEDGCDPEACMAQAQAWATRCGEREGSPLAVLILGRVVARSMETDRRILLDVRSCSTLAEALKEGARCLDEKSCQKAWRDVQTHQQRCGEEGAPEVAVALRQMAIAVGAGREGEPIAVADDPERAAQDAAPLMLADGSGAIMQICRKRILTVADYLDARDGCRAGVLSVARLVAGDSGREVRLGRLTIPEEGELVDAYPSLMVVGEADELAARAAKALDVELSAATAASGDDALVKLLTAVDRHARWIEKSESAQKTLAHHDDALKSLFALLGQRKAEAALAQRDPGVRRSYAFLANGRPLADWSLEGKVELGAVSGGRWLETEAIWPHASEAHKVALRPLTRAIVKGPAATTRDHGRARKLVAQHAAACTNARNDRNEAAEQLISCIFQSCGDAERSALAERRRQAAAAEAEAVRQVDLAVGPIGLTKSLRAAVVEAGCEPLR